MVVTANRCYNAEGILIIRGLQNVLSFAVTAVTGNALNESGVGERVTVTARK